MMFCSLCVSALKRKYRQLFLDYDIDAAAVRSFFNAQKCAAFKLDSRPIVRTLWIIIVDFKQNTRWNETRIQQKYYSGWHLIVWSLFCSFTFVSIDMQCTHKNTQWDHYVFIVNSTQNALKIVKGFMSVVDHSIEIKNLCAVFALWSFSLHLNSTEIKNADVLVTLRKIVSHSI